MPGLKLREEFLGAHMPGTAIALRTNDNQGAAQKSPDHILSITYPTADVQTALKAISAKNSGRPVVLMGDRGRGKSHIMAVMHHGVQSPEVVEAWLQEWGNKVGCDELKNVEMLRGYAPISEPVHNHEYLLLWDLLFDRHPRGQYYRGQFESMPQPFPPRTLLEKIFEDQPTCLILDEFQTWYTGLPDKDPKSGLLLRQYAFNFIQILSEIATDRPEILIFVISVLNNQAVLILDALSLRELPVLLAAAETRGIQPVQVMVTGSECPSTTDHFAKSLGLPSRSALANDGKPGAFALFGGDSYTDVVSLPFEDCAVPPSPHLMIWHSWLDDLIHLQQKLPDQIASIATSTLQSDGFWNFINRLRQGRGLIITSDHGYAVSKRFSSEVEDPDAIDILRKTFGASRHKAVSEPWRKQFMPPVVMTHKHQHVVMGQRKWKVQGGFPHVCHGGMSLLEVAAPYMEFPAL